MPDYHLTPTSLASALGVSRQTVHDLLKEKRAITPLMALRLSVYLAIPQNFGREHSKQETCGNLNNNISMISITFIRLHRSIKFKKSRSISGPALSLMTPMANPLGQTN